MKENAEMVQFCFVGRRNVGGTMKESESHQHVEEEQGRRDEKRRFLT